MRSDVLPVEAVVSGRRSGTLRGPGETRRRVGHRHVYVAPRGASAVAAVAPGLGARSELPRVLGAA